MSAFRTFLLVIALTSTVADEYQLGDDILELTRTVYDPQYHIRKAFEKVEAIPSLQSATEDSAFQALSNIEPEDFFSAAAFQPNISQSCKNAVSFALSQLSTSNNMSVLKVFDSWGKPGPAILEGRTKFYGSFDECLKIVIEKPANDPLMSGDFTTNYCNGYLPVSKLATIQLGLCLPKECSTVDASIALWTVLGKYTPGSGVVCQDQDRSLDGGSVAALVVVIVILSICVLATLYDEATQLFNTWFSSPQQDSDETVPLLPPSSSSNRPGLLKKVVLCFSFYSNWLKTMSSDQPRGAITCVNGIRFISMTWVILGHTLIFYSLTKMENTSFTLDLMKNFATQAIFNATLSVDTFFVLSGLLVAYLFLRDFHRRQIKPADFFKALPMIYLHRYLRLTPAYGFMIMVWACLGWYMWNGPAWPTAITPPYHTLDVNCINNSYLNLLYVNNLFDGQHQCAAWGWYLANDTQFFLVAPFIVYIFYLNMYAGLAAGVTTVCTSIIAAGVVANEQNATMSYSPLAKRNFTPDMTADFPLYTAPWTRFQSYGVGIIAGALIYKFKDNGLRLSKMNKIICNLALWAVAIALCMTTVYANYSAEQGYHMVTLVEADFFNAFARTAWCVGVSCLIISCSLGWGGWVNEFLSWKGFVPLSRLTYCAYLIHIPIMSVLVFGSRSTQLYTYVTLVQDILLITVAAYLVAFPFSLMFEVPFIGLDKLLLAPMSLKAEHKPPPAYSRVATSEPGEDKSSYKAMTT